jgi:hypothetical protein
MDQYISRYLNNSSTLSSRILIETSLKQSRIDIMIAYNTGNSIYGCTAPDVWLSSISCTSFSQVAYIRHQCAILGGSIPFRKELTNMSALSGSKEGTICPAPLTIANTNPLVYP